MVFTTVIESIALLLTPAVITVRGNIHERKSSIRAYIKHHFERESQSLYEAAKRRFLEPPEGITQEHSRAKSK